MSDTRIIIRNGRKVRQARVDHPKGRLVGGKRVPIESFWRDIPNPTGPSRKEVVNVGKISVKRNRSTGQFV